MKSPQRRRDRKEFINRNISVFTHNDIKSPQRRKERKAVVFLVKEFLCELCVFALKMAFMDKH